MKEKFANFVDLLNCRADFQANKNVFTFLPDGETESLSLTYQQLDQQARAIAVRLQGLNGKGERALLIYQPGLEFIAAFFGCLYAGVIAVPAYPPRANRSLERLQSIVSDAQAAFALTTEALMTTIEGKLTSNSHTTLHCITTDNLDLSSGELWQKPELKSEQLAFLQYTSGSTGNPKGVMVSHGNLIHNSALINHFFQDTEDSRGISWLPPYHDMGLIGGILQPVYVGASQVIMPPVSFLQRPLRWLQAISQYGVTISGAPNFAYQLCANQINEEQKEGLDLSCWQLAFSGAEPIRSQTLQDFAKAFADYGFNAQAFYPCYGMAETTLIITGANKDTYPLIKAFQTQALEENKLIPIQGKEATSLVSCGKTAQGMEIIIVNPDTLELRKENEIGEVWVKGESVAQGYWQQPELTKAVFAACPRNVENDSFLRTGDLGFLSEGELFITGRLKDLIIIRGRNYYPQDIELTVEQAHPAIRNGCGAAFSVERNGEESLVVVYEVNRSFIRKLNVEEVNNAIRKAVITQHQLVPAAIVLLKTGSIPKTSSGKIQRFMCRLEFLEGTLNTVGEWQEKIQVKPQQSNSVSNQIATGKRGEIQTWLLERIASKLGISVKEISVSEPFVNYGLDSVAAVRLTAELEDWLGVKVSPTLAYDYPTIQALSGFLAGLEAKNLNSMQTRGELKKEAVLTGGDIAIIGMACRLPGANNLQEFWQLLSQGGDGISYKPGLGWGGFLEDIKGFDGEFFQIGEREAREMDPQQRLLLEVTWEALENARLRADGLAGSNTGVFIGISGYDYANLRIKEGISPNPYASLGNAHSIAANRLSYWFDFRGPSLAIDTACSSSLVALHLAARNLQQGDCQIAIAGGVNVLLLPELTEAFQSAGMMAEDGRCKTFDEKADGYVRSEGCGVVVLKRLEDAVREGNSVLAVIKGSAINQDGRSNGLTAPNGLSQQAVIEQALENAGISADKIDYIETHGTGTALGDPIEVNALKSVVGQNQREETIWLSSVKTNIGHLEAAAGIAGVIKTVLCLQYQEITPNLHYSQLNPLLDLQGTSLKIPTQLAKWQKKGDKRRAGVSSFGFGGTNAHLILEEAPNIQGKAAKRLKQGKPLSLFTLSAHREADLWKLADLYSHYLEDNPEISLHDLCVAVNQGRTSLKHRLAIVSANPQQLQALVRAFIKQEEVTGLDTATITANPTQEVVFLFTGQGSQYVGMGKHLYETEVIFRDNLHLCADLFANYLDKPLLEVLYPERDESELNQTLYTQCGLFAIEYALAQLWLSWGIKPAIMIGHSVGEYVAATLAGVFSLEDGIKLIAWRGRLMEDLPDNGGMVAVFADEARVKGLLVAESLEIAVVNSPENVVIAGSEEILEKQIQKLEAEGIKFKRLQVSNGFHSALMEPMLADFAKVATTITYNLPEIPIVSNLTGKLAGAEIATADYWLQHIRSCVRFKDSIIYLGEKEYKIFLEIGPKPVLLGLTREILADSDQEITLLPSLKPSRAGVNHGKTILTSLGSLYLQGIEINLANSPENSTYINLPSLPNYPFQHQPYWLPESEVKHESPITDRGEKNIPQLYQIAWQSTQKKQLSLQEIALNQLTVIFAAETPATEALLKQWQMYGLPYVAISNELEYIAGSLNSSWGINFNQKEDYVRLWQDINNLGYPLGRVIYYYPENIKPEKTLEQDRIYTNLKSILYGIQTLPKLNTRGLWIITNQAISPQPVAEMINYGNPVGGIYWGLSRVIALEYPELWGGIIDVDKLDIEAITAEIFHPDKEIYLAFHQGKKYLARLREYQLDKPQPAPISAGSYLITGGLGVVGLQVAQWLAKLGAKTLILVGRSAPTPEATRQIESIEKQGVKVLTRRADVAVKSELEPIFAEISTLHPLKGIIHAAGILDDGLLANLSWSQFEKVLSPKIKGAWNLHQLSQDFDLDFFILFSSAASLLGSPGQGNYAAANGFLDALSSYRANLNLPSLTINLGLLNLGMGTGVSLKNRGINPISLDLALEQLPFLLSSSLPQIGVLSLDKEILSQQLNFLEANNYFAEIISLKNSENISKKEETDSIFPQLSHLDLAAQETFIINYLQKTIAHLLEVEIQEISPQQSLLDLGLDSLMVMEAINRVKKDLQLMIYPREIYQNPVIQDLGLYLIKEFNKIHKLGIKAPNLQPFPHKNVDHNLKQFSLIFPDNYNYQIIEKKLPPIAFILSSPRSGSTLLRVMLAGHPDLISPPELHLLPFNTMKEREESLSLSYLGEGLTRTLMTLENWDKETAEKQIQTWVKENTLVTEVYRHLLNLSSSRLFIDKSPTYAMNLDVLKRAESIFTEAKYIHLIRHPYPVIESFSRLRMDKLIGIENDNPYQLAESIWRHSNENILALAKEIPSERYLPVLYEDLVTDTAAIMAQICQFLQVPFHPAVLNPYQPENREKRMTDGVAGEKSLGVGDPNFNQRQQIDSKLADSPEKIKLPQILSLETQKLAASFNYKFPSLPVEETMIQVRGINIGLSSWGADSEELVLCLHGILDCGLVWEPLAQGLVTEGYRVVAPDLAGHGRSEHRDLYHFLDFLADLEAICHSLTDKPIILVGHSLGAVIAASYASIRPKQLKKLVLVEPVIPSDTLGDKTTQLAQLMDSLTTRPPQPILPSLEAAVDRLKLAVPGLEETLAQKWAERVTESVSGGWRWRWDALLRNRSGITFNGMTQADYLSLLEKITVPVTVVYGDKSDFNRPEDLQKQKNAMKTAKQVVLSGYHHLQIQSPSDLVKLIVN